MKNYERRDVILHPVFSLLFQIRPVLDSEFSFKEADKAYNKIEEGHARGKIVLNMQREDHP